MDVSAHSVYFHCMKWCFLLPALCVVVIAVGCNGAYPKAENAFDAGREFIDASLKGDWDKARFYMLRNEANDKRLEGLVSSYRTKSNEQKEDYHEASINILEEDTVSDSVHIISYKNSFDNIARKLKVVQTGNGWQVDLSYTFSGNL